MLCSRNGMALMEDAGCTARLDSRLWERVTPVACEFQLRLQDVCEN
jgi:hypothetical protein